MPLLEINELKAGVEGKHILKGVNLSVEKGSIHAIMGPNGSGKSTLASILMGHPSYEVESGKALLEGKEVFEMTPDERAKAGMFLAFQYPSELAGVKMTKFARTAINEIRKSKGLEPIGVLEFRKVLDENAKKLRMAEGLSERNVNEGFSGGEKKRSEILQMMLLEPKLCILDEIDSGLDVDALKSVAEGINAIKGKDRSIVIITHYERILNYVKPDFVHVMHNGRIIKSGSFELALEIDKKGYDPIIAETTTAKAK